MTWAIKIRNLSKVYAIGKTNITAAELVNDKLKSLIFLGHRKAGKEALPETEEIKERRAVLSRDQMCGDNEFFALKNVNIEVKSGERVGITGPNGCGKSTLLKILSRIVSPSGGEFQFRGRLISLLEIGTGFHGDLTGRENIYLNGTIMGMTQSEISEKLNRIIDFSELGAMIDTPVKRYSSGMYVRLAFAVAAHLESEILIVDEVLAVGDADFQKKCTDKMLDLANQGRTLIFVSHNMEAVSKICDRIIRMEHGQIVEDHAICIEKSETSGSSKSVSIVQELDYPESRKQVYLDWIRMLSINIQDASNTLKPSFDVTEEVHINIAYEVIQELYPLSIHLKIIDGENNVVFTAMDNKCVDASIRKKGK